VFLWSALQSKTRFFTPYTPIAFVADWLINCGATLFAITVYSKNPLLLNALLLLPAAFLFITNSQNGSAASIKRPRPPVDEKKDVQPSPKPENSFPIKPFVTMYRGSMMVITCAAILAVDFRIFPRRFAKVENWGTSLMDLGVGSFVFSAGVVSVRSALKARSEGRSSSLISRLKTSMGHSIPLLILGFVRLWSVKGVNYAEHVTEYGVHWNFFFTLGFLPPFVAVSQTLFELIPSYLVIAIGLGTLYECLLDFTRLTAYIITAPRANLISQNREGIFSFIGYLAIFLAGQGAGIYVLPRENTSETQNSSPAEATWRHKIQKLRGTMIGKLLQSALIYSALFAFTTLYQGLNLRVSRRLANLPYVLWISAFNCVQLTLCVITEKLLFPNVYLLENLTEEKRRAKASTSRVLHAFNRNGLAIFLLANLLTGAVNLSMPTLHMGTASSMGVLVGYMGILGAFAVGLDIWDISIKL
jgi:phosphatidylinositol glycan class W